MRDDPYRPVIKILKQLTKDSANVTNTVLGLFTGARKVTTSRAEFATEMQKTIEQVTATAQTWQKLEKLLMYMESAASEVSERELVQVVERAADATMLTEQMEKVWGLAENDCALRMLQLDPELIPYAAKEVSTFENGKEQLKVWYEAIGTVLDLR